MPAPVSLASMKRQAELEQEGEQEPVDDKSNVNSQISFKIFLGITHIQECIMVVVGCRLPCAWN